MIFKNSCFRRRLALRFAGSLCAVASLPLFAADPLPSPAAPPVATDPAPQANLPTLFASSESAPAGRATPSQNVTINLINRLVERKVLTKDDAAELIKQAEEDAQTARSQAAEDAVAARAASEPPPASDESVRVTYIPEVVKAQMRDQIKQEVMEQARNENWAAPNTLPPWVSRFRFMGDVRVRYEGDFFPAGNDNTGAFPNFNAINTGSPYDVSGTQFAPQLNVDQNRTRFRLRARFGAEMDLGEGFTSAFRIGTGDSSTPVSGNQSFGLANQGQGGNFSKYAIWLDRAFLKYQVGAQPTKDLAFTVGRFDNPFFSVTNMIWENDLGFDGAVLQGKYEVVKGVTPFLTVGAFPIFNTDLNFSSIQPAKFKSEDKYLFAGQFGTNWKINQDFNAKVGAAYYYFHNVEGQLSNPYTPLTAQDQGNTDDSRPSFAQKGNTYMALRDIVPNATNNFGATNQWQYFGLATPFHNIVLNARLDYNHFEPVQVSLFGEYAKNLAFDSTAINAIAVNNRGPNSLKGDLGAFAGTGTAWIVGLKVGSAALEKRWDWNASVNYRYVGSDAVIDGFCDSDFGGGGTNLKGYTIGGSLALSQRVWLSLRWMSANAIAGPTYRSDIVQFDINGKF